MSRRAPAPLAASGILSTIDARSELGVASKKADPDRVARARQNLAAANIAAAIDRALATAPPLTDEMAEALAARLRGSAS